MLFEEREPVPREALAAATHEVKGGLVDHVIHAEMAVSRNIQHLLSPRPSDLSFSEETLSNTP